MVQATVRFSGSSEEKQVCMPRLYGREASLRHSTVWWVPDTSEREDREEATAAGHGSGRERKVERNEGMRTPLSHLMS
jgi:hypothetical protein